MPVVRALQNFQHMGTWVQRGALLEVSGDRAAQLSSRRLVEEVQTRIPKTDRPNVQTSEPVIQTKTIIPSFPTVLLGPDPSQSTVGFDESEEDDQDDGQHLSQVDPDPSIQPNSEGKFPCPECGREFVRKTNLLNHLLTHRAVPR